ncbi:recombinase family protein [Clostridium sp. ASF356]|nr:recombinase family protein [Clostridium sp. MD294]
MDMNEKVAIYCRLSEEDSNKIYYYEESESIQNQKLLLTDYAAKHNYEIYKIYIDENYSGLYKNRPAFCEMIQCAQKKAFDIVLCKTQSRFTRDIEVFEKYVHELFPLWGIRFISVVDNIDTSQKGNKKARQINALINEWYCEDLSENIKMVLKRKMAEGQFVGAFACYGYQKSTKDKHKLIVDEKAAEVVKQIFELCIKGYSCRKIAENLTEQGIVTPTMYKRQKGIAFQNPNVKSCENDAKWSYNTVKKILRNECYIGNLIQGKERKINYKQKKRVLVPKKECVVIEGSHKAIIQKDIFYKVQKILDNRSHNK